MTDQTALARREAADDFAMVANLLVQRGKRLVHGLCLHRMNSA